MPNVTMTLEEFEALRDLIRGERESEGASLALRDQDPGSKKKRKKSARSRKMSKAIKQAMTKMKKANGQFRKGKSMADVMRLANKLADKM
mgnify:CR=1 FL=1